MTNTPFKFDVPVPNGAVQSSELTLKFPQGKNAYRIKSLKVQIDDLDVEAAEDLLAKIQLAYQNLDADSHIVITDKNEILTLSLRQNTMTAVNELSHNNMPDQIRDSGFLFLDGKDFTDVFIVKNKFWVNCSNSGQDATENFHITMKGQYVNLSSNVIEALSQGANIL